MNTFFARVGFRIDNTIAAVASKTPDCIITPITNAIDRTTHHVTENKRDYVVAGIAGVAGATLASLLGSK
jgi:hypothetical protein